MIIWWFWGIYRTEYIVGYLQNVNELFSTDNVYYSVQFDW
jgi:hypothetical protein